MTVIETHTDVLERMLSAYRTGKYDIVHRPDGAAYGWHPDFRPDFLASHERETVVVAITSREAMRGDVPASEARREINRRPGWRMQFEFAEDWNGVALEPLRPDRETLRPQLTEAEAVLEQHETAGLLLAAALLEAHLREAVFRHGLDITSLDLPDLIGTGAVLGYVEDEATPKLVPACATHERVVHGFLPTPGDPSVRDAAETFLRVAAHVSDELDDGTD